MTLIEAIREAVTEFWHSVEQNDFVYAVYNGEGLRIDDSGIDITEDMVDIPSVYSQQGMELEIESEGSSGKKAVLKCELKEGDRVLAAVHHGGQRYAVLYKL